MISYLPILRVGVRYLLRHRWQTTLMIVGITLGVAVVVAIDLANVSASRAFDLSTETIAGRATHQIVGGPAGLDEDLFAQLRRAGVSVPTAPVVTDLVVSPQLGGQALQLLGVDPFSEAPFRSYLGGTVGQPLAGINDFLTKPGAVFLSTTLAERYGLVLGEALTLEIGGRTRIAFVAGLVEPADSLSRRALDGLMLADIATAQELTGRVGRLDHIDVILPEGDVSHAATIQAILPAAARLLPAAARNGAVAQMTAAFRTNLTALSLLALLVGMFLIYNTMTFSVVQRRQMFGRLRCLGVTSREIFLVVVAEAVVVGTIGGLLGLALGVVLGQGAISLVTRTINDLYFTATVQDVGIPTASLLKGGLLGLLATVGTAMLPAYEAANVPPRAALFRAGLETKARGAVRWTTLGGVVLAAGGGLLLVIPSRSIVLGFSGIFAVLFGIALLAPGFTLLLMQAAAVPAGRLWGALGRMAPRDVVNALSRTSIAIAALMVAVSVTIGVSVMITSFRSTVIAWLEQTLQGDIYVSPASASNAQTGGELDLDVVEALAVWPGVTRVDTLRLAIVDSPQGPVQVGATNNDRVGIDRLYYALDLVSEKVWAEMQAGGVLVSEPFAVRMGLPRKGGLVTLFTDKGERTFPVVGTYYDYSSSQGTVIMTLSLYRELWDDTALSAAALVLDGNASPDEVARDMQAGFAHLQRLEIRANRNLRADVLLVFDRTFAITGALQLLATLVAFTGVLSALLALQLEKRRILGILRAVGLTARQLWGLVLLETGLIGSAAGLLALPTGYVLALILIFIINRRSFGWTLQLQLEPWPFLQALAVSILAALLAGIYPARKIARRVAGDAIRYE